MSAVLYLSFIWLLSGALVAFIIEVATPIHPQWAARDGSLRSRAVVLWVLPFVALLVLLGQFSWKELKAGAAYIFTGEA